MENWISSGRLSYLIGFPIVMIFMLYLSALLGLKWQRIWLESALFTVLKKAPGYLRLIAASLAGALTPFCSCTTIPGFAAILEAKLGLDTAMAFLIASPTIDPAATLLLSMVFGVKFTALYVIGCFVASVLGGWIIGKLFTTRDINPALLFSCATDTETATWEQAKSGARVYVYKFWWVIVLSTLIGFLLYDYVPDNFIFAISKVNTLIAIPLASIVGIFLYAHMVILIPIGAAMLAKGIAPGIIIAFLASSAGISPPEILLLRKIISLRLTVTYVLITITLISAVGFIVNWLGR